MFLIHVRRDNDHLGPHSDMATGRGTLLFMGRVTNPGTTIMRRAHQDFPAQDDSGHNGGCGGSNGGNGDNGNGNGDNGNDGNGSGGSGHGGNGNGNGGHGYKSGCGAVIMNMFAISLVVFISMTSFRVL